MHTLHLVTDFVVYLACGFFAGREFGRIRRAQAERKTAARETAVMAERLRQEREERERRKNAAINPLR